MEILHGSNVIVDQPVVKIAGHFKDFGFGFYCTKYESQARKWALTKRPEHIVNVYDFTIKEGLSILSFDEMTEEWLDFVAACRQGVEHHYDIVEGPMADDQIWDYVEDFVNGVISREAFWALAKFKHPTHQIVFCSEKSLSCVKYLRHYSL